MSRRYSISREKADNYLHLTISAIKVVSISRPQLVKIGRVQWHFRWFFQQCSFGKVNSWKKCIMPNGIPAKEKSANWAISGSIGIGLLSTKIMVAIFHPCWCANSDVMLTLSGCAINSLLRALYGWINRPNGSGKLNVSPERSPTNVTELFITCLAFCFKVRKSDSTKKSRKVLRLSCNKASTKYIVRRKTN